MHSVGPHSRRLRTATVALSAALTLFWLAPASGDWLVTVDGSRIATRGGWEVKGSQVRFTSANGTFSALPLSEVDMVRSEALTAAAKAPPKEVVEEEAPKKKAVMVITDKDIPRYRPRDPGGDSASPGVLDAEGAEAGEGQAAPATGDLQVVSWEIVDSSVSEGVTLSGSVINSTTDALASIRLLVRVYDASGQQVGQRYAEVTRTALPPGEQSTFTVNFPDVLSITAVRFESRSARFQAESEASSRS